MYTEDNLYKLINKHLSKFEQAIPMVNSFHRQGMSRINLQIIEMILLDKPLEKIQNILLLTDKSFENKLIEIIDFLRNFKKTPLFINKR